VEAARRLSYLNKNRNWGVFEGTKHDSEDRIEKINKTAHPINV
jgi:hypothetical protein